MIDDAWIDPDVVERYDSISTLDSTGLSLLLPGENDADIQPDFGASIIVGEDESLQFCSSSSRE